MEGIRFFPRAVFLDDIKQSRKLNFVWDVITTFWTARRHDSAMNTVYVYSAKIKQEKLFEARKLDCCIIFLRRRSAAARLLRSWVRIPPGAWIFVCCECCVLSGRGLCDELITRPEESCRLWCVVVCDLDTSRMRRPWPALGRSATKKNTFLC
jgi:hypothetical protein